jgi:hypothetical protein
MVLEKAWAKIFGSYSKIEAGLPRYETFIIILKRGPKGIKWCSNKNNLYKR